MYGYLHPDTARTMARIKLDKRLTDVRHAELAGQAAASPETTIGVWARMVQIAVSLVAGALRRPGAARGSAAEPSA
jgi:hypothetical protein